MSWRDNLQSGFEALITPDAVVIPPFGDASEVTLPAPAERTRRIPADQRAAPRVALSESELASKLERLTHRALDRADDLLEMDISDEEHDKFGEKVRGLNSAIKTIVQTQVRVDEHRLRARKEEILPQLLEAIAAEEKRRLLPA